MYTEREPYLATSGTDSCWQTWHNSAVQRSHHRQTRSNGAEGWKDASEDNKWMIVQCATFSKCLNPRNIDKSVSDIRIRSRFPFESSFWISLSGCKLTILPDIQPANRIVIISAARQPAENSCFFSATRPSSPPFSVIPLCTWSMTVRFTLNIWVWGFRDSFLIWKMLNMALSARGFQSNDVVKH